MQGVGKKEIPINTFYGLTYSLVLPSLMLSKTPQCHSFFDLLSPFGSLQDSA
jgi:hypothetical protein